MQSTLLWKRLERWHEGVSGIADQGLCRNAGLHRLTNILSTGELLQQVSNMQDMAKLVCLTIAMMVLTVLKKNTQLTVVQLLKLFAGVSTSRRGVNAASFISKKLIERITKALNNFIFLFYFFYCLGFAYLIENGHYFRIA